MTTLADLEALAPEWDALWDRDTKATPFQSPAWLIPWTRHLWGGGELLILEERQAGELTGLLPLFRWGAEKPTVSFLGAGVSDYGGVLGQFHNLELPPDAVLEEARFAFCTAEPCSVCPVLDLSAYPATLDPKLKTDLHRATNKLKQHDAHFTLITTPDQFLKLHAKRWNPQPNPNLEKFQREVIAEFAKRKLLRLHFLTIDGRSAASIFAIAAHGTLYCYLSAYDPELNKLSPGALLLNHAIQQAKLEGLAEVDFLRGSEPYKYLWGARDRINYRVRAGKITPQSEPRAGALEARL